MGDDAAARARRLALAAWQRTWPQVRERLPEQVVGVTGPADAQLARQLARDAEAARRAHAAAVARHSAAVSRRERVLRRSRRAVPAWSMVAGASVLAAAAGNGEIGSTGVLAVLATAGLVRVAVAAQRLRHPPAVPPPPALGGPPPPPHPRSAAFPAVRRLEQARGALHALLPLVGPGGREVAEQAWAAAAEADTALRWQAARLAAAEPHLGVDGGALAALEAGVAAQERLVQGVADLVAAAADPHGAARLQDLTDRLHGLAAGLREVRQEH